MQSSTISFTLKNSSGSSVAGSVSYNSTTYITTFTPNSALAYNTTYTATISGAQSTSGVPMTSPFSWSFTTDPASVAPTVTSETPASGATDLAVSTAPTATFNEAVQSSSISFTLKNSSGSSVAGSISYNSTTYVTIFTPSSALAYNTTYTATISGAQSTSGVPMTSPFSWSFTTDPAAPKVVSESPASGATSVAVTTKVTATFNEAVQASTISFTLKNSAGRLVAARVTYNSTTDTATLTPTSSLSYSTKYTATVSGAKDSAGDPMGAPFSWSFTTVAKHKTASPAPAKASVALVNDARISNQSSSQIVSAGSIQEALKSGDTILVPVDNSGASASIAALQSSTQSNRQDLAIASMVSDTPIGIMPDTLLNMLTQDRLQPRQRRAGWDGQMNS